LYINIWFYVYFFISYILLSIMFHEVSFAMYVVTLNAMMSSDTIFKK